jgi:HKD family nuclease
MKVLFKNWYSALVSEIDNADNIRIISPFIKEEIIKGLFDQVDFSKLEIITRFSLADFASGVSSIEALEYCIHKGASVYGVKRLHSKVYLFDKKSAIISSANLTSGGLKNNFECGILINEDTTLIELDQYFGKLKGFGNVATLHDTQTWKARLNNLEIQNTETPTLPDFGATDVQLNPEVNYYVKFFGSGNNRVPLSFEVKEEVDRALCHYACGFSRKKKPKQIRTGDIIYMARLTYDPYDFSIFGKAEAIEYVEGRDEVSSNELIERPWKEHWPIYLRVKNATFIDGTMEDGVLLYDLISALDHQSFESTKRRYAEGKRDINPNLSLSRQPYVKLSLEGAEWVEERLNDSFERVGKISNEFISSLPKPEVTVE